MATEVIAMCILKQAQLAKVSISPLKRLGWVQPASEPFTMMRCTVTSTWNPTRDRSSIILRSVIRFPIRASQHPMSRRKSHVQRQHEVSPLPNILDAQGQPSHEMGYQQEHAQTRGTKHLSSEKRPYSLLLQVLWLR